MIDAFAMVGVTEQGDRVFAESVQPLRTDAVKAQEIRDEMAPLLDRLCEIMNRSRRDGLIVNFQIGLDPYGRSRVQDVSVLKPL